MRQSGVYYLQIRGTTYWFLKVYCEQEIADGGWTVRYQKKKKKFNQEVFCVIRRVKRQKQRKRNESELRR
jgi:hypothetical protein